MKKSFLIILLLPMLSLAYPVSATDWNKIESSGDWDVCERTHWEQNDVEVSEGTATWKTQVINFSGYYAVINFTELYTRRLQWWHESASKWVDITFNITSDNSGRFITVRANFWDYQRMWGLEFGRKTGIQIGFCEDINQVAMYPAYSYDLSPAFVEIYVWINETESKIYAKGLLWDPDVPDPYDLGKKSFDIEPLEFTNVTITQTVRHGDCGYFKGGLSDTIYQESWTLEVPEGVIKWVTSNWFWDFVDGTKRFLSKTLPGYVMDLINTAGQWASFFLEIIVVIGYTAIQFLPLFPIIFVLWLIDVAVTSVVTGDFRIVGDAVMGLYNTLRGIVQAVINFAETIWSIIKFW